MRVSPTTNEADQKIKDNQLDEADQEMEESVDLFEILEDRYAYEGFNKFVFLSFWFLATYQLTIATFFNMEVAKELNIIREYFIAPEVDMKDGNAYSKWSLKLLENSLNNPDYYGHDNTLLRATLYIRPYGCHDSNDWPRVVKHKLGNENGAHKSSLAKTYETEHGCRTVSSKETNDGLKALDSMLRTKYGIVTYGKPHWEGVSIPIYSAEIIPANRSKIWHDQLNKTMEALAKEEFITVIEMAIELINPYTHTWYSFNPKLQGNELVLNIKTLDTTPRNENVRVIILLVVVFVCFIRFEWEFVQMIKKNMKLNEHMRKKNIKVMVKTCVPSNYIEIFLATVGMLGILMVLYVNLEFYPLHSLIKPRGTVSSLEDTTKFADVYEVYYLLYNRGWVNKVAGAIISLCIMALMIKQLSWHSGTSVLTSTIKHSFGDLVDTLFVVFLLLSGFAAFGYIIFGAFGGATDFVSFPTALNTMARLSFGLYEYDQYMSDGKGTAYVGVGLGSYVWLKYTILWMSFLLLSTIIINILIAVISDGYEIHKDSQRLRTRSGETLIEYAAHRVVFLLAFQWFPYCLKSQPNWVQKMRLASSAHLRILLGYTDAVPDGLVFDKKLQSQVLQALMHRESTEHDVNQIVRRFSSIQRNAKAVSGEVARNFFANIPSEKILKEVIKVILEIGHGENEWEALQEKSMYFDLWSVYKRSMIDRGKILEARVDGNHIRKVVRPLEKRIKRMEDKIDNLTNMLKEMKENGK